MRSTLAALFYSMVTGWGLIAIYVLVVARFWPASSLATYGGALLVAVAVLAAAGVAVFTLHRRRLTHRVLASLTIGLVAALTLGPAWLIRLVPPAEVADWLARLFDARTSLVAWIAVVDVAHAPVLGDKLIESEIWIALAIELVLLVAAIYLMAWSVLRQTVCTSCRSPCERERGVAYRRVDDAEAARQRIERRAWAEVRKMPAPEDEATAIHLRFDLTTCPACSGTNLLTVVVERGGRRDAPIIVDLPLSRDDARTIDGLGDGLRAVG